MFKKFAISIALTLMVLGVTGTAVSAKPTTPTGYVTYNGITEREQVVRISATQFNPPSWGLDRIDQRSLPLNKQYVYNSTGLGVRAYVIDTGIYTSHTSFGGRASHGWDFVDNDPNATDCQ